MWQQFPAAMPAALAHHHAILNQAIAGNHGHVFQIVGDAFHAAFPTALDGVNAAFDAQRALCDQAWGEQGPIRVRMALHTAHGELHAEKYDSGEYEIGEYLVLARTARLMSAGYGGQVLLSTQTAENVRAELPSHLGLRDLGRHRVKDFEPQQIFQITSSELWSDFPPLQTLDSLPNNLPVRLTRFIGRFQEIRELQELLTQTRLLTLTGPGGAGKTRLSLQLAAESLSQFKDGVWFIEFAPLTDASLVPQVTATTLGLHEQPGRPITDVLTDHARDKTLLLILDNCEHLIDACARLADALLQRAPHLTILASSREPLNIGGETIYPVPPLSFPHFPTNAARMHDVKTLAQFEAVRLFTDRARAVQPAFRVTAANARAVVAICQRLDGIPLALELAAARVRSMTVEQIAERLDHDLRLLTGGSRTAMPHHQTLQATIQWSYVLLADDERLLFERLAVFAGGWSLQAVEQVSQDDLLPAMDVLDVLHRLVDKSLVVAEQADSAGRYRFLETIRRFAYDKLAASETSNLAVLRNRHLEYFLNFVLEIDRTVRGSEQASGLQVLDRELDNVRAALRWAAESNQVETELRLASALSRYWRVRSYFSEGRRWFQDALTRAESASSAARARAMLDAGSLANYQADYARAQRLLESSLALYRELRERRGTALALNLLSHGRMMTGDLGGARRALEESLSIFRELNDSRGTGYALYFLGYTLQSANDMPGARSLLEESLARFRQIGDKWWEGNALIQLGWGSSRQGEHAGALQLFDDALEISKQFDDTRGTARAFLYIAETKCSQSEYAAARAKYIEALKLFYDIGDKWWGTACLEGLAYIAIHQTDPRRAAQLLGAAEHMHEILGAPLFPAYRASITWSTAQAQSRMGEQPFAEAWAEGQNMTYESSIQLALKDE